MTCSTCHVSHAPHELRPYPPTDGAKCLECVFTENKMQRDLIQAQQMIINRLSSEKVELEEKLEKYGNHTWSCATQHGGEKCDCGFLTERD